MSDMRAQYLADRVVTASPAALVTMLYDRLLLDVDRATAAADAGKPAREHLLHAQSIISELMTTLDVNAWDGAPQLFAIYSFLLRELIDASVSGDLSKVAASRTIIADFAETWRQAASAVNPATSAGGVGVA